jgi:hypothetical protein
MNDNKKVTRVKRDFLQTTGEIIGALFALAIKTIVVTVTAISVLRSLDVIP